MSNILVYVCELECMLRSHQELGPNAESDSELVENKGLL